MSDAVERQIRFFMALEAAAFVAAVLVHFGLLIDGFAHEKAGTAESVIGIVLLAGLASSWARPGATRRAGLAVQAFAFFGTLVGAFTIAIGVSPRTAPDIVFHIGLVVLLVSGLAVALRAPAA